MPIAYLVRTIASLAAVWRASAIAMRSGCDCTERKWGAILMSVRWRHTGDWWHAHQSHYDGRAQRQVGEKFSKNSAWSGMVGLGWVWHGMVR